MPCVNGAVMLCSTALADDFSRIIRSPPGALGPPVVGFIEIVLARIAYAIGTSPLGPFERAGKILQQDPSVATGAGHHSILHAPKSGKWYIVYHRRPLGETDRNHRVVCIDELKFDDKGGILPVVITKDGVARDPVK